uniref:SET domain-containing protein n=1 Tax=Phytophthora ramorum TaxID=164328 RepID=H3GPX8_PHYRM
MAGLAASQLPPEELHAGDKIAYYSMAFVCGNPQGYREAIVLKVDADPGATKPLDLDSSDIISSTQMLKRLVGRWGNAIGEGGALWRHASEASRGSEDRETQDGDIVANSQVVAVSDYLQSIPTRLKRAKIRHQAKKRPARWHVPRSRKRRDQKKCAVTRSGMNIYHAHTVKARSTKETLQRAGVKDRLRALHVRWPKFVEIRTETLDLMKVVIWPSSVLPITESEVPEGLEFLDIGGGDPCQCFGDCFMDSCKNALLSIYCTPECCRLGGVCSNSPRNHPGLKLYDTCRVGLGVHTTDYIEVGDVVSEYVGRLFEYPAVLEGQPALAIKQNSGYTMLLNTQSVSGMFVYIEALKCGSITRFMSHSCDPNVKFVEMQNGSKVKVLARMIKTVWPGTQLTVNYGDEIWFKCGCDSCWVDPVDEEE